MDYVKIPQNVRVEDKLIGPLSLKQIIMIAIGGGFSYALFALTQKTYGYVSPGLQPLIWGPAVVTAAFALIKINDISLFRYCLLIGEMLSKPRKRVWQPRQGISINIQTRPSKKKEDEKAVSGERSAVSKSEQKAVSNVRLDDINLMLENDQSAVTEAEVDELDPLASVDPLESNVDSIQHSSLNHV